MSLREFLDVVGRCWRVSIAILLLTLCAGWLIVHPKTTYLASEIFTVQPPASPQLPNQLHTFRPSLAITAAMVAKRLKSPSGEVRLRALGVVGDYDVVPRNSGTVQAPAYLIPSLRSTVTTNNQASALRSVAILVEEFRAELTGIQDDLDVALNQRITIAVLAPASASLQLPSKSRALAGVGILGLAGSILLPLWFDQLLRRRARGSARSSRRRNRRIDRFLTDVR